MQTGLEVCKALLWKVRENVPSEGATRRELWACALYAARNPVLSANSLPDWKILHVCPRGKHVMKECLYERHLCSLFPSASVTRHILH